MTSYGLGFGIYWSSPAMLSTLAHTHTHTRDTNETTAAPSLPEKEKPSTTSIPMKLARGFPTGARTPKTQSKSKLSIPHNPVCFLCRSTTSGHVSNWRTLLNRQTSTMKLQPSCRLSRHYLYQHLHAPRHHVCYPERSQGLRNRLRV